MNCCYAEEELEMRLKRLARSGASNECVALAKMAVADTHSVTAWMRGENVIEKFVPLGTPIATFLDRQGRDSVRYDGGEGVGIRGNRTTHAAVLAGYIMNDKRRACGISVFEQYTGSNGVRRKTYMVDESKFGTGNAKNYFVINGPDGLPLGGISNPFFDVQWRKTDEIFAK